jgi:hypothetical protein
MVLTFSARIPFNITTGALKFRMQGEYKQTIFLFACSAVLADLVLSEMSAYRSCFQYSCLFAVGHSRGILSRSS